MKIPANVLQITLLVFIFIVGAFLGGWSAQTDKTLRYHFNQTVGLEQKTFSKATFFPQYNKTYDILQYRKHEKFCYLKIKGSLKLTNDHGSTFSESGFKHATVYMKPNAPTAYGDMKSANNDRNILIFKMLGFYFIVIVWISIWLILLLKIMVLNERFKQWLSIKRCI